MKIRYAVTFEFDTRPPVTYRGTVEAGHPSTAARRAIAAAQEFLKPVNWTSFVFVALERLPEAASEDAEAIPADVTLTKGGLETEDDR